MDQMNTLAPTNGFVNPMLTDLYQITMAYAYYVADRQDEHSVFDLFFRKNPFKGEYTIFGGLEEVIRHVSAFKFTEEHVDYLRKTFPHMNNGFFEYLLKVDCSEVQLSAVPEGSVVFPREPLIRVTGPLGICQLLETTLLNLCNYASLMTTNATRFRCAAGKDKILMEFGLRRAQGPDGAISAARYSYIAGFDGTSNVLAGSCFGIPIFGTHAHSFVTSYTCLEEITNRQLKSADGSKEVDFVEMCLKIREETGARTTNTSELAAFIAYALAFPTGFLALVDTYDTLQSGVPNTLVVALALHRLGYVPTGIRLDSGDLAYLSKETRRQFIEFAEKFDVPSFAKLRIVASNDINEPVIHALNEQEHQIDAFGIGTHLVTCQAQPALGMVYKLVEIHGMPRIKLSQVLSKITIPCSKSVFRLYGKDGIPLVDLIALDSEEPKAGERILCRHPFNETKRVMVKPSRVERLLKNVFDGKSGGIVGELPNIKDIRSFLKEQVSNLREDHIRSVNPTPYKVSVSETLFEYMHKLWMQEVPISELE